MTLVLHSELPPLLGVSRAFAGKLAKRDNFPPPADHTNGGKPLWLKADVERYQRDRMAKHQPPPKEAKQHDTNRTNADLPNRHGV